MPLADISSYADLRKLVSPAAFAAVSNFLAWHNRQRLTAPMGIPLAVSVALAFERRSIDRMLFRGIKAFFDEHQPAVPRTLEECEALAERLLRYLFPHDYSADAGETKK